MADGITRKTPIGELVASHPIAAAVLLDHGFHCVGCELAAHETIEEGAAAHGMDDAAIDRLVEKIRAAAGKEAEVLKRITGPAGKIGAPASKGSKGSKPG